RHFMGGLYTDGTKYLADKAGAYWLLDAIFAWQTDANVSKESFQVWSLRVNDDKSALLTGDDGNGNEIASQAIPFTDFPLSEIQLYFTDRTVLLPGEY
ncbi:MAG: hypothetical protein KME45_26710, partial [Stenomitos rutilans HA7619-LM2]|nr:hypothetical protein [Stenomitos rutilans HA7619-LM2]